MIPEKIKLHEITINNIISSLFVNENILIFKTIFKSYKYKFQTVTYDFHFKKRVFKQTFHLRFSLNIFKVLYQVSLVDYTKNKM